jgi:hypothetical protein
MEELPIQFFLAFDSNSMIHEMDVDVKPEDKHKITLYSYHEKLNTDAYKIIYENEVDKFEPNLQKALHKEGTMLYHLFFSKEYTKYQYIGFGKHYTKITSKLLSIIQYIVQHDYDFKTIYVNGFYPRCKDNVITGPHKIMNNHYSVHGNRINIDSGLKSYNRIFNTNYTIDDVLENKLIKTMTFMISKGKFEKLMYFLSNYFFVKVKINIFEDTDLCNSYYFMEALIGMFLSLEVKEGARYIVFSDLENM